MQMKKIFRSRYVKKDSTTLSVKQERQFKMDSSLPKYYQHITELPLKNFIDFVVNDNVYALIISGNPDVIDLQLQWHEISQEYAEAIGDSEQKMYAILLRDYTIASANFELVRNGIKILKLIHHPSICETINKVVGVSLKWSVETYDNDIKSAYRRSKAFKVKADLLKVSLESMNSKDRIAPTKEYFQKILIALSDKAGFYISDSITTFEFCERIKQFNEYHENLKKNGSAK